MDDRKTLMNYIGPGPWLALLCVLLLAATLLCAFYTPPAVEFEPVYPPPIPSGSPDFTDGETEDEPCYLLTVAVSDAICQSSDGKLYYAVEDYSHYFHIASVSGETYALMGAQRDLWNNPDAPMNLIRITGRRLPIPDEVKQDFLSVFSMDADVFDMNFGHFCLVEDTPVAPEAGRAPAWTVLAVVFSLCFLAAFALWLLRFLPAWSALVRLEENESLGEAARQFADPAARAERGDALRLTEDYLFGWRSGLAAAWEDVVWSYERSFGVGPVTLVRVLMICTADGKTHPLFFTGGDAKKLRRLANLLCERNPKMRWDNTAENRNAWREMGF